MMDSQTGTLMLGSHMTIEVALLSKLDSANRTYELWLDTAFVMLVPPKGGEKCVGTIALGTGVSLG